jgi:hypothetical protein
MDRWQSVIRAVLRQVCPFHFPLFCLIFSCSHYSISHPVYQTLLTVNLYFLAATFVFGTGLDHQLCCRSPKGALRLNIHLLSTFDTVRTPLFATRLDLHSCIHLFLADDENFYPEGLSAVTAIADIVEIELFNPDACKYCNEGRFRRSLLGLLLSQRLTL